MGQLKDFLVAEDVLEEVFSYLPKMQFNQSGEKYPVQFGYGDHLELNLYLKNREESDVYPLIWLLYPLKEEHLKTRIRLPRASFILSVTTNQTMENQERLKLTYGKILMPLFHNIRLSFRQSNVVSVYNKDEMYDIVKFPNYSENSLRDKAGVTAIWDALKFTVDLDIIQGCIKPIKFF